MDKGVDGAESINGPLEKSFNIGLFVQVCGQAKNLGSRADGANSAGRLFESCFVASDKYNAFGPSSSPGTSDLL